MDPNDIYRPHSLYKRKFNSDSDSTSDDDDAHPVKRRRDDSDDGTFKPTTGYALKSGLYDLRSKGEFDPRTMDNVRKEWYTIPTETGRVGDPERLAYLRSNTTLTIDEIDEIRRLEDRIDTSEYSPNWLGLWRESPCNFLCS